MSFLINKKNQKKKNQSMIMQYKKNNQKKERIFIQEAKVNYA